LQLGVDGGGFPSEAKRQVECVHAEVAHDANFAARVAQAFPVGGFA
jgi:hypothetical protein